MKNTIYIISLLFLFSCHDDPKNKNRERLIHNIKKCIATVNFNEKILEVCKMKNDYGDYDLYNIKGFFGIIVGEEYPDEIIKVEDKYIFLYIDGNKQLINETDSIYEKYGKYDKITNTMFYFAICKRTQNELLVKVPNQETYPYEIPELREFSCSQKESLKLDSIELIIGKYSIDAKEHVVNKDTILFPQNISAQVHIYNRSNSRLFFAQMEDTLGHFYLINGLDTLQLFKKFNIGITNLRIDDPEYEHYPDKRFGYLIDSDDTSFFNNLNIDQVNALIRDSLFYFPNAELYAKKAGKDYLYPTKKLKIIVPDGILYHYITSDYYYTFYGNYKVVKEKKHQ